MTITMKDFYKILGVKENASEEKIRARWVKLTKHYHPDRGEDMASDEKIREINEAYQILKHSSTRVEYDLQRAYGQGKRGSYFKKLSIPASLLILVIMMGVIYIKNYQSPPPSEPIVSNKINQTNQRNETDQTNQRNETDQTNQRNEINQRDPTTQKPSVASKPQRITTLTQPQQRIDVPTQQPQVVAATPAVPTVLKPINQTDQKNQINQKDQTDQINQRNQIDVPVQQPKIAKAAPAVPIKQDQTDQIDQINQIDLKLQVAQFKPPSPLATEDDVRKFFANYIERYNQMDLEGFLSLFSSKAIQNQKNRIEGTRKIYTDFFNQGQEVRCQIQDMKIEIYQNAVEVKARYQIEQISKKSEGRMVWKGQIQWVLIKENGAFKIVSLDYQHD